MNQPIRWIDPRDGGKVELVPGDGTCTGCKYFPSPDCPHDLPAGGPKCGRHIWRPVGEAHKARLTDLERELLEAAKAALLALEGVLEELTVGERYTNAGQGLIDALSPIRAAIAKAEGGAK